MGSGLRRKALPAAGHDLNELSSRYADFVVRPSDRKKASDVFVENLNVGGEEAFNRFPDRIGRHRELDTHRRSAEAERALREIYDRSVARDERVDNISQIPTLRPHTP